VDRAAVDNGLSFNSITNAGVASALGAGSSISVGIGASAPFLTYTGNTAASSNRTISLVGGEAYITSNSAALTLTGNITTSATQTLRLRGAAGGGANFNELSGVYSGGGSLSVQTATGSDVWKISGNNTFTGATSVINIATLIAGHSNAFGSTANGTLVSNNAQILLTGNISVGGEALTLNTGAGGAWNGQTGAALRSYTGNNSWAGSITIGQATTIATNSGAGLTLSGNISGSHNLTFNSIGDTTVSGNITTGTGTLSKTGLGTLTLSGSNSYLGSTTLDTGTLVIGHANAVGTGTFTQSSGSSLLKIDTTGTIANTMSVYNVQASQSATLSGAITVNNANFDVDSGDTLTLSGAVSGSGGVTKNGTGTLVLSSSNSYAAATTVNSGTLTAAAAGATGNSTVINVTGGSFLVTAANAVNDNAAVNLGGGRMAVSGNFDETVGLLTLSANSTIDFSGFAGTLRFGGIGSWAAGTNLAIWNWSGTTQYGTQINNYANPSNIVFTNNSNLASNLFNISFYSDSGNSFVGNGFEVSGFSGGGSQIIAVPETETYFYAVALLAGVGVQFIRRRAKRKSLELYPQT
jgi:autotransporter-associated beta strand protein